MSVFDAIVQQSAQVLSSRASVAGIGAAKAAAGPKYSAAVDFLAGNADLVRSRDWNQLAARALNSNAFTSRLPWLSGFAPSLATDGGGPGGLSAAAAFEATASRAMGGVLPKQARQIVRESLETNFGRRNLFMFDVSGLSGVNSEADFDRSTATNAHRLNLFVLDASYGVNSITAEAHKVGGSTLDQPTGTDPMELRLTTLDDETGYVKRWFENLRGRVARRDGTFGVPADYLVRLRLLHSFVTDESAASWLRDRVDTTWSMAAWFRPVSMEMDVSRKDQALEELTLTFHQYDTHFT